MPSAQPTGAVIERPELIGTLRDQPVVALVAPAGHGASTLLAQLGAANPGPSIVVRCTDAEQFGGLAGRVLQALTDAFPVLDEATPVVEHTGGARLRYALEALAGPATLMIDDAHVADPVALNEVIDVVAQHAPDGVVLAVGTHGEAPAALARAIATRGGRVLGARDLLFDEAECAAIAAQTGSPIPADELAQRTGGWPLAVTALARGGEHLTPALGTELIATLSTDARRELAAIALVASVPAAVIDDGASGDEIRRFAGRHPAALDFSGNRLAVRPLVRAAATEVDLVHVDDLADRLEHHGDQATALVMLSRVPGARTALQDRLQRIGPPLLATGRFRLLHDVIGRIPAPQRRADTLVLDAMARFALQQLEPLTDAQFVTDDAMVELAERDDLDTDLRIAIAGLRTDVLRRNGDTALVAVALDGLALVGPIDAGVDVGTLVRGRSALARRGIHWLLYGLGVAALFSGDGPTIVEGRRLQDLALAVAERSGLDTAVVRGQMMFERVSIGLERPSAALVPLEASIAALRSQGHPDAANHLAQLADLHIRLHDPTSATAAIEAGWDWAERTGNRLVEPSLDLVTAATALIQHGPNPEVDDQLTAAWERFIAAPRLRRIAPGAAARFANSMLDANEPVRAAAWIDRAQSLLVERLQGGYQSAMLDVTRRRLESWKSTDGDPMLGVDTPFAAQPAGAAEYAATIAWDRLRRGDGSLVANVVAHHRESLDPPWPTRLGLAADTESPDGGADVEVRIRVLGPEVRLERHGRPVSPPSGHSARLLARLVLRDGVLSTDAAIEDLWPDAPAAAARNRFHQVLHRTRRALGNEADGVLTLADGVLRLDPQRCTSDVAELKALAGTDLTTSDGHRRALGVLGTVESSLCAAQFGFDESLDDDRWDLDRRVVELAVALLDADPADPEARTTVWTLWDRLPEQWALGEALERSAVRAGLEREAARARRRIDES